jgi:purine-cytosine permease-like protein
MKVLLFIISLIVLTLGALIFTSARSAIHEIEAFLLFLIASVFMCTAALLESLHVLRRELLKVTAAIPSDQTVADSEAFRRALLRAARVADSAPARQRPQNTRA